MTTSPNQGEAVGSTEIPDEYLLEALGSTPETLEQDHLKAFVPQPSVTFLRILRTQRGRFRASALPPAWRSVQLALARILSLPIESSENTYEPCTENFGRHPHSENLGLKKLLMVLYYHQVWKLVGEMNSAGADSKKQEEILGKLAEPLQRYSKYISHSYL